MWFILGLAAIGGLVLVAAKVLQAKRRRHCLLNAGRVRSWNRVTQEPLSITKIVRTDFGFGREVWAVGFGDDEIDPGLRAFRAGVLIRPAPRLSDLTQFCRSHGLECVEIVVRWGHGKRKVAKD